MQKFETLSGILVTAARVRRLIPKIVAYISCSTGCTHFAWTKNAVNSGHLVPWQLTQAARANFQWYLYCGPCLRNYFVSNLQPNISNNKIKKIICKKGVGWVRVLTKYISETLLETFLQSTSFEFYSIYKAKLTTFNLNFGTAWHSSAPACILMSGPDQGPKVFL